MIEALRQQPGYHADLAIIGAPDGDVLAGRIACKDGAFRLDTHVGSTDGSTADDEAAVSLEVSMLLRPGHRPVMLLAQASGFSEFPSEYGTSRTVVLPSIGVLFNVDWLEDALAQAASPRVVGNEDVDGHPCVRVDCSSAASPDRVVVYSATDLGGLVIKYVTASDGAERGLLLRNVSLDVADSLFVVPDDNKPLDQSGSSSADGT